MSRCQSHAATLLHLPSNLALPIGADSATAGDATAATVAWIRAEVHTQATALVFVCVGADALAIAALGFNTQGAVMPAGAAVLGVGAGVDAGEEAVHRTCLVASALGADALAIAAAVGGGAAHSATGATVVRVGGAIRTGTVAHGQTCVAFTVAALAGGAVGAPAVPSAAAESVILQVVASRATLGVAWVAHAAATLAR
jgi:hypothetical protein